TPWFRPLPRRIPRLRRDRRAPRGTPIDPYAPHAGPRPRTAAPGLDGGMNVRFRRGLPLGARLVAVLTCVAAWTASASAQAPPPCDLFGPAATFPHIPICAFPGGYRDHSLIEPGKCLGLFTDPLPDSIDERPRTITVRFRRDRRAENRKDFGGYRIYRVVN